METFSAKPIRMYNSCQYSSNHFRLMLPGTLWNAIFIACFQVNICDPERGESFLREHQCFIVLKWTFYHSWKPGKHTYLKFFLVKNKNPSFLLSQCLPIAPILTKLSILQWRHNECDSVSNHQSRDWLLLIRLFRRWSTKTPKLRGTDLCTGNSPVTGEFHAQMVSNAENASIWWRHHVSSNSLPKRHHRAQQYIMPLIRFYGYLQTLSIHTSVQ